MALFIAQTDGTTDFEVTQVQVDVIYISVVDTGVGFDEDNPVDMDGISCIPVTYTQNETGPTADRLNALVNDVGFTSPPNIVIFGVDESFTLSDGTPLIGNGVALDVGSPLNPLEDHVTTLYDVTLCGGAGTWVDAEGGGTVQNTTEVVLYHELSHCFHMVTDTLAPTVEEEEVAAEIDENDMRDVRGIPRRDVNSHNGGCGGGEVSCCIIASLATGGPLSAEVARLRYFRDHVLRQSRVGDSLFSLFLDQYYGFSPEVCRLMARKPHLKPIIQSEVVHPLLAAYEFVFAYCRDPACDLAAALADQQCHPTLGPVTTRMARARLRKLLRGLRHTPPHPTEEDDETGTANVLLRTIRQTLQGEGMARWLLVDVLEVWLDAMDYCEAGQAGEHDTNTRIKARLSDWIAQVPITSAWGRLNRLEAQQELSRFARYLSEPEAMVVFARRFAQEVPAHGELVRPWINARRGHARASSH